ncbi:DUF2502 domain-containing protein [Azonexus sp.]|jgi:hypothetical protein|uniref:DUF2502 domain-containing protein n=1 Tax=Azonexus sp. TaxID=1872668 RepID=UPI00282A392F|nr:DUF2502 domain-containing protein [Azonexus sp.]MDR1995874.1 DUF2502 domain-containing protein [Azonexus sp.]
MKKLILAGLIATSPLFVQAADININVGSTRVQTPGANLTFGSRDSRGNYWDGGDWRDRNYWERHHGPRGEKFYTGRPQGVPHQGKKGFCPPGQAKKGNC